MIYASDVAGEFVLLVETDLMLLATTQSVLADSGYRVASCSTPEEALTFCGTHPRARVVLSKVIFPGSDVTGLHLAAQIHHTCRAVTVLTDRHNPSLLYGLRGFESHTFLPQPYTSAQVLAAIAEAWEAAGR
jgi:CheY-like chemotaxis protein